MYAVVLYLPFGAVYATEDSTPRGKLLKFNTEKDAEKYARSLGFVFETVKVKE